MASQITSLTTVYPSVYSGADNRKQQSSVSQAFVRGIHRWSVYSPHKGPVTQKMFPFDDVIMSGQKTVFKIHSNPIIARSVSPTYDFYHTLVSIALYTKVYNKRPSHCITWMNHFSAHISKWELVCKFGVIFHIFIISCLCSRFHVRNQWFFYSVITFSYIKCFVHSYTVDVVFTLSH